MDYKALTYINLPLLDIKKAPGDIISTEEFLAGGQTDTDISLLILTSALSEDLNAPLNPDNEPVPPPQPESPTDNFVITDDVGKGTNP